MVLGPRLGHVWPHSRGRPCVPLWAHGVTDPQALTASPLERHEEREAQVYLVPFVEDEQAVLLKNHSSRKATGTILVRSLTTMTVDADEKELLRSGERGEWKSAGGKRERTRSSACDCVSTARS